VRGDAASTIEKAGLVPIFPGSANFDPEAFLVLIVITIDNKASKSGERPALDLLRGMSSPWPATQCSRRQLLKELKMRRAGFIAGPSAPPSENGESDRIVGWWANRTATPSPDTPPFGFSWSLRIPIPR
jgi:hypothetical protein